MLASTGHVLRQSVNCLKDFSANDAGMGFESISQYANNLFIKPWRKEYRVIKVVFFLVYVSQIIMT